MRASTTELNKHPGQCLKQAIKEYPVAVMTYYDRDAQLEDTCWGELAVSADREKSLSHKAGMNFLQGDE